MLGSNVLTRSLFNSSIYLMQAHKCIESFSSCHSHFSVVLLQYQHIKHQLEKGRKNKGNARYNKQNVERLKDICRRNTDLEEMPSSNK